MLRSKNDRDILNLQQPITNNNQRNIIPPKTVPIKNNIINNRILLNPAKKLIIDPQNKAKLLKSRPVENIYKDNVTQLDLNNYNYSNIYNPYIDHNRPKKYIEDNNKDKDKDKYKYYQTPYRRYPYWAPLWMQYNDPYIRMYDLTVLVPITNGEIGSMQINNVNSYQRYQSDTKRNAGERRTKYAPFIFPEPIIVKKKSDKANRHDKANISNKKEKSMIEQFAEFFRLPQTHRYQNRVNRINHIRGPSRALSNGNINIPSRMMHNIRVKNDNANRNKHVMVGGKGDGFRNNSSRENYRGNTGGYFGSARYHSPTYNGRHYYRGGGSPSYNSGSSYWGGSGYYGNPYCAYGNCPYNPYYGTYNYQPFADYYWYENRYKLPFDLNSALLPVNVQQNQIVGSSINQPNQLNQSNQYEIKLDKINQQLKKLIEEANKRKKKKKVNLSLSSDKSSINSSNINNSIKSNLSIGSTRSTGSSGSNKIINENFDIPKGYQPVTLKIIEIIENNNNGKNANKSNNDINLKKNVIFLILLIILMVYMYKF